MSTQENKDLLNRMFMEAFNEQKPEVLDQICSPNFNWETPEVSMKIGETEGLKSLKDLMVVKWKSFPDIKYSLEDVISEANMISCGIIIEGTFVNEFYGYAPTGKKFMAKGLVFGIVDQGKFYLMRFCIYGTPWLKALGV